MRAFLGAAVLAAALGFGLSVADDVKKDDPKTAEKEKAPETLMEKLAAMQKGLRTEMTALQKDYKKAAADERPKIIERFKAAQAKVGEAALALAKAESKNDDVLEAVKLAVSTGNEKTVAAVVDLLATNYVDDLKILPIIGQIAASEGGSKPLEVLLAKSKNKSILGYTKFVMLEGEIDRTENAEGQPAMSVKDATKKYDEFAARLDALVKEHGEVAVQTDEGKTTIAKSAEKKKYMLANLVIGRMAPDVECEIVDIKDKDAKAPKKGKLSDFRGKVVVLDIWATWCGPCVAMIPHERDMVNARKDKKFAFISVSADAKLKDLTDFLEKTDMPWTQWWDGAAQVVTEKYKVEFFPTIYVLDAQGIIRYKGVRGKVMDEAVDTLLKEMETGGK